MLQIYSKLEVNEKYREFFIQRITQLIYYSRENGGCISFELFHDLENTNSYCLLEIWKNEACELSYKNSDNYKKNLKDVIKTLKQKIQINKIEKV